MKSIRFGDVDVLNDRLRQDACGPIVPLLDQSYYLYDLERVPNPVADALELLSIPENLSFVGKLSISGRQQERRTARREGSISGLVEKGIPYFR